MTHLIDAIDTFLAKYPDDAPLTWQRRRKPNALDVIVADLLTAAERMAPTTNPAAAATRAELTAPTEEPA